MNREQVATPDEAAPEPQGADEIDELFNLGANSVELRHELEAALAAVDQAKQSLSFDALTTTTPSLVAVQPSPSLAPSVDLARPVQSIVRRKTLTAWVAGVLVAALVAINVFMVVVVSRSNAALADKVAGVGAAASQAPSRPATEPGHEPSAANERPEGYRSLDLARQEIERGDHAFARRRLYSLLAVVDGIQEPARGDIEARAGLAIGDSYRLQASTLGGSR
jgi:hypothetical protein